MSGAARLAHPPERRQEALDALKKHGSLRKASKATGIPVSTIQTWAPGGITEPDAPPDREGEEDVEEEQQEGGDEEERRPVEGPNDKKPLDPINPDLPNQSAAGMGTVANLEVDVPATLPSSQSTLVARADDPRFMQAFRRYVNLLANDVHPSHALDAVQQIDETFELSQEEKDILQQHIGLMKANGTIWAAERFVFSVPTAVREVYGKYSLDAGDQAGLAREIEAVRREAYLGGINANLAGLGRQSVDAITDPAILQSIQQDAQRSAADIVDTHNAALERSVGQSWIELQATAPIAGEDLQGALDTMTDRWQQDRAGWKGPQIAQSEAGDAYNAATFEFQRQNGAASTGYVTPEDAQCPECQDMVDMGEVDADTLMELELPAHPNCDHEAVLNYDEAWDDSSGELWAAQADDGSGDEEAIAAGEWATRRRR